ncbi:MAG: hydrogenase maturation nickel metallochaperone HypA [Candidatus Hermodarchaeota archaeon]
MHEYSLASEIADIVVTVGKENHIKKITQINIDVGEFSFVVPEQIVFWLKILSEQDANYNLMRDSHIEFREIKGLIKCSNCNYQGTIPTMSDEDKTMHNLIDVSIRCPKCDSPSTTILQGRDVVVSSIQGN